jgi:hypothetical protein
MNRREQGDTESDRPSEYRRKRGESCSATKINQKKATERMTRESRTNEENEKQKGYPALSVFASLVHSGLQILVPEEVGQSAYTLKDRETNEGIRGILESRTVGKEKRKRKRKRKKRLTNESQQPAVPGHGVGLEDGVERRGQTHKKNHCEREDKEGNSEEESSEHKVRSENKTYWPNKRRSQKLQRDWLWDLTNETRKIIILNGRRERRKREGRTN